MSRFELSRYSDAAELAGVVAAEWLRQVRGAGEQGAVRTVALAGGRITQHFFRAAASLAGSEPQVLGRVEFFWGDERCVPAEHPESNFALARLHLLDPLGIAPHRRHRIRGEAPPEEAVRDAEAELRRIAPANSHGQPILDLVFLGMGEDGHVASLFPGESEATMLSSAVYRCVTAVKPPPQRITLGYGALAAARGVWVLASGAGKTGALRESLAPDGATPLAHLLHLRQYTRIFTDLPA
jgi:6-phosphogluconolactonase